MKMNKLITTAAVALSVLGFVSTSASAANVVAGANDLILGFQATDTSVNGNNTVTNLEVDLGPISSFTTTTATTILSGLTAADLSAVYGSGWATRTDLTFAVAGKAAAGNVLFITANANAVPYEISNNTTGAGYVAQLASGLNGKTQTANSTSASAVGNSTTPASSIAKSYTIDLAGDGSSDFGFQPLNPGDAQSLLSTGSLELYSFAQAAGSPAPTDIGHFSLNSSGVLSFTGSAAAVPEPSTYMLGLFGLVALMALRRRNSVL